MLDFYVIINYVFDLQQLKTSSAFKLDSETCSYVERLAEFTIYFGCVLAILNQIEDDLMYNFTVEI